MEKDDIDNLYIEATQVKKAHTRKMQGKHIKVRSSTDVAKETYKNAKKLHKAEIQRLKRSIKSHRLLIEQARNQYKIVKLSAKIK